MATKKKAASKKVSSKGGKRRKAADKTTPKFKWRFPTDGEAGHSPIIITDGSSASIEFAKGEYDHQGNGHHTSSGLGLSNVSVIAGKLHPTSPPVNAGDPPGSAICHNFEGLSRFTIEVTARVGDENKTFIISGRRPFGSPTIDFNINTFKENASYPPKFPLTGARFVNAGARITGLKIFRSTLGGDKTLVHDCPLVPRDMGDTNLIEYTIGDPHI